MKSFNDFALEKAWRATGLLEGMSPEVQNECVAALEGQRRYNENSDETPYWRRVSVPVVRRVFGIVEGLGGSLTPGRWVETPVRAEDEEPPYDLQKEADSTATIAVELANHIKVELDRNKFSAINSMKTVNGKIYLNVV